MYPPLSLRKPKGLNFNSVNEFEVMSVLFLQLIRPLSCPVGRLRTETSLKIFGEQTEIRLKPIQSSFLVTAPCLTLLLGVGPE